MKAAVIGASGYVGAELIALLINHDQIEITELLVSEHSDSANISFSQLHPRWQGVCDLPLLAFSPAKFEQMLASENKPDAVFFATPHEFSADWAGKFVNAGIKVFDLSGGFRLKQAADYPTFLRF